MLKKISIICALATVACCEEVIWEIPLGSLKGLKLATAYLNKTFYSFRSVPYVKPVTGINKFEVNYYSYFFFIQTVKYVIITQNLYSLVYYKLNSITKKLLFSLLNL